MGCFIEPSREFHLRKPTQNVSEITLSQLVGRDTNFSVQCLLTTVLKTSGSSSGPVGLLSAITARPNSRNSEFAPPSRPPAFPLLLDRYQRKPDLWLRTGVG